MKDFPEPKPVSKSAKLPFEGYNVTHTAPSGNVARLNFGGSALNVANGENLSGYLYPLVSPMVMSKPSRSVKSAFHHGILNADMDVYQSDLVQAAVNNTIPSKMDMLDFSCSGKGPDGTSSVYYEKLHSSNTRICQKYPLQEDDRGGHVPSVSFSGCPRVYCLRTSGILLLSNTGVLGVVCSCHYSHMSVSKFCKHSGLSDANPGDVVLMDNGQTIAQWRQLYFEKFGIMFPEDQCWWDWPEGLSGTTGLANSSCFMPKCSSPSLCRLAGSRGCLMGPGQHSVNAVSSNDQRSAKNFVIDGSQNKLQRSIQGRNNHLSEGLPYSLDQNQHVARENEILECQRSRCFSASSSLARKPDNMSQSSCYVGSIRKIAIAANELPSFQKSRNLAEDSGTRFSDMKTANDCVLVDRDPAASKVELGLGQPHEQNRASGNLFQSFMGLGCLGSLNDKSKTFHGQMVHNLATASKREESRKSHKNDMSSLSACARKERQVNPGNPAYSLNNAVHNHFENGEGNADKSSEISLFQQSNNIFGSGLYKDSYDNRKGCEVVEPMLWHSISDTAKHDSVDVRPIFYYGPKVPLGNSGVDFHRIVDRGNVVKCLSDSSCVPTESRFTIQGKEKKVAAFTGFTVRSSAERNDFSDKLLSQPQDAAFNRESNSLGEKFSSYGYVHNGDNFLKPTISPMCLRLISPLQASSSGFHLEPNINPTLSKQEGINMTSCLLDDNMRLLALRQILELSQQQQAILGLMSHGNEGYSGSSSFQMQHTLVDPLKVAGEKEGTQSTCRQNDFEVDTTSLPVVATSRMFGVPPETGQNYSRDDSMATANLFSLEANMQCQTPLGPLQHKQPSPRLNQYERIFPAPTIVERCYPILGSMSSPSISVGARQMTHPRGSFEFQADRTSEEWTERAGSKPHMFVAAENVKDNACLEEKHVALDQSVDLSGKILGSSVNLSIQCIDGPSEVEGKGNTTCMDHVAHLVVGRGNEVQLDRAGKCFDRAEQTVDSLKEHEKFIVSSGCSAPAVTQVSITVNNDSTCAVDAQHVECANQEHETSIVSSGCSAPAVTQASVTVNNDRTRAVDAQHVECANQLVVDEVSGVDQCCTPDYPSESKGSAEFHCTSPQANAERVPSEVTSNHLSNSLLDSCTWNKGHNRIHDDLPVHKRSKYLHKSKTVLKIRKRQRVMKLSELGSSFSTAGHTKKTTFTDYEDHDCCLFKDKHMFLHSGHRTSCSGDDCFCKTNFRCYQSPLGPSKLSSRKRNLQTYNDKAVRNKQIALRDHINYGKDPLVRCVKKLRGISASDASGQPELNVMCHENAEKFSEHKSTGFRKASPLQVNAGRKMARPMVYGLYGEICRGKYDLYVSKPAKIISLSRILKKARKCGAPGICGDTLACTSKLKKAANGGSDALANGISNLVQNEDSISHDVRSCELLQHSAAKSSIITCLEENNELCAVQCGKNSVVGTHAQLESNFGRVRERTRSLNELSLPGVSHSSKKFSLKNSRTVTTKRLSKILKDTEIERVPAYGIYDITTIKCYAEPDRLSNLDADAFCCICRSSKQDKVNCLLEGSQCLVQDLLQSEVEVVNDKNVHFYGRCAHRDKDVDCGSTTIGLSDIVCTGDILRCARTEGYKERKRYNVLGNLHGFDQGKCGSLVPQDQINAWTHIHGQKKCSQAILQLPHSVAESDCRKEYGRYKQAKGWKRLLVYKSGIHALGLYASQLIYWGEMVVEYVGEIVGLLIADKREREYQSGRRIQSKSACYFFRIDKEHIIDATRKGGIARFVNHSCQPNCVAKVISVRDEKKVVFFAKRDILPGEEITYDYHFNHEDEGKKILCYCKSKNCRLYLN